MRLIDADLLGLTDMEIIMCDGDYKEALKMLIDKIEHATTIEPEQQWIPCSERLPKKSGKYYVSGGGKAWICEYLIIPNFIGGWCNDASNPVVQAWMPKPKPWKGEENE